MVSPRRDVVRGAGAGGGRLGCVAEGLGRAVVRRGAGGLGGLRPAPPPSKAGPADLPVPAEPALGRGGVVGYRASRRSVGAPAARSAIALGGAGGPGGLRV